VSQIAPVGSTAAAAHSVSTWITLAATLRNSSDTTATPTAPKVSARIQLRMAGPGGCSPMASAADTSRATVTCSAVPGIITIRNAASSALSEP
jgi:hypothetical protein